MLRGGSVTLPPSLLALLVDPRPGRPGRARAASSAVKARALPEWPAVSSIGLTCLT